MAPRVFEVTTGMEAPIERCFDLSLSIDLHVRSLARSKERAIAGVTSGQIGLDEEVTWEGRHFGIKWRMTSRITELDRPHRFVDQMVKGPFRSYRHEHLFADRAGATLMTDIVSFSTPGGPFRSLSDALIGLYLKKLIETRNGTIKLEAESKD